MSNPSEGLLSSGQTLGGRYEIESVLGAGGMGHVYRAHHLQQNMAVAIKQIHCASAEAQRSVRAEAETLSRLSHPTLPRVFDFLQEGDFGYIVMELVPGRTLLDVLLHESALPSEARVLAWAAQLCTVLAYLHQHKPPVIFRDLKPANIMVCDDQKLKLIDFGISKVVSTPDAHTRTIVAGAVTPGFSPPEQYVGGTDARSDIYALGATLFALASGTRPPDSVELSNGVKRLDRLGALNPVISERTAAIIEWMMSSRPDDRPQSMAEVQDAFAGKSWVPSRAPAAAGQVTTPAPPAGGTTRKPPFWTGNLTAWAAGGALCLALLGAARWQHQRQPTMLGHVTVWNLPEGAQVSIDDAAPGTADADGRMTLDLPLGSHRLQWSCEGYSGGHGTIEVTSGEISWAPKGEYTHGDLEVVCDGKWRVEIDGQPRGAAPGLLRGLPLGQHAVHLVDDNGKTIDRIVLITPKERQVLRLGEHPSAVVDTPEPTALTDDIVPGRSLGGVRIGEASGEALLRRPQMSFKARAWDYGTNYVDAADAMSMLARAGRINEIIVGDVIKDQDGHQAAHFHTAGGTHVGSTANGVRHEFGSAYESGVTRDGRPVWRYREAGIFFIFDVGASHVTRITVAPIKRSSS